jgi:hypothetical protein
MDHFIFQQYNFFIWSEQVQSYLEFLGGVPVGSSTSLFDFVRPSDVCPMLPKLPATIDETSRDVARRRPTSRDVVLL